MAITEMAFVPATGWNDPTTFPEKVSNASDVRDMLQLLHDQTKDYLNNTVKPAIDSLQAGSIPTGKIEDGAVTTPKLADGAVTNAKLGSKAVKQANIDDLAVGTGQIAAKAVTATQIADATITATQIANTTITGAKMANGTVTSTQLSSTSGSEAVATGNIRASAVTDAKIASGITGSKVSGALSNATIDASKITSGTLSMDRIGSKAITAAKIADATITATQIANTTITGAKMANGTVTATQLASNAVETAKIKDGNVTTAKIADGNVTTGKLASGAVTTAKITDGNVTSAKIANGAVTTGKTDFVETTLSPTLDTKVPTSKAIATYANSIAGVQTIEIVPVQTGGSALSLANQTYSKALTFPITMSNFTGVRIEFSPGVFGINGYSTNSIKLRVDGKNSGGTSVNYTIPVVMSGGTNGAKYAKYILWIHSNGGGMYEVMGTNGVSGSMIEAGSGFPATITGLSVVWNVYAAGTTSTGMVASISVIQ